MLLIPGTTFKLDNFILFQNSRMIYVNLEKSLIWPNITERRDPLPRAEENLDKTNKFQNLFIDKPASQN